MKNVKVYAVEVIGEFSAQTPYLGSLLAILKADYEMQMILKDEEIRLLREQRNSAVSGDQSYSASECHFEQKRLDKEIQEALKAKGE